MFPGWESDCLDSRRSNDCHHCGVQAELLAAGYAIAGKAGFLQ